MAIGNTPFKAINKHSFNWQVVPSNLGVGGGGNNLIWKSACNAYMHKSILKQAWVMDSSAETQKALLNSIFQVVAEATNLC